MKKSLAELFDISHDELLLYFDIRQQLIWAIDNLQKQLEELLNSPECFSLNNTEKRMYLSKAITKFQGNLSELNNGYNTAIRKIKDEAHYK
jgi:hypothetical protein